MRTLRLPAPAAPRPGTTSGGPRPRYSRGAGRFPRTSGVRGAAAGSTGARTRTAAPERAPTPGDLHQAGNSRAWLSYVGGRTANGTPCRPEAWESSWMIPAGAAARKGKGQAEPACDPTGWVASRFPVPNRVVG